MKFEQSDVCNRKIIVNDEEGERLCDAIFEPTSHGSYLIAEKAAQMALAAPDMLEALNLAFGYLISSENYNPKENKIISAIEAAIKKAGGV